MLSLHWAISGGFVLCLFSTSADLKVPLSTRMLLSCSPVAPICLQFSWHSPSVFAILRSGTSIDAFPKHSQLQRPYLSACWLNSYMINFLEIGKSFTKSFPGDGSGDLTILYFVAR